MGITFDLSSGDLVKIIEGRLKGKKGVVNSYYVSKYTGRPIYTISDIKGVRKILNYNRYKIKKLESTIEWE